MKIAACSINPIPGDVRGNLRQVEAAYQKAVAADADMAVFPELALLGYPINDLIAYQDILRAQNLAIAKLFSLSGHTVLVLGIAERNPGNGKPFFNSGIVMRNQEIIFRARKVNLPTYGEFDERRWLEPGTNPAEVFVFQGKRIGLLVCEDIWALSNHDEAGRTLYHRNMVEELAALRPDVVLSINASPYYLGKRDVRLEVVREAASKMGNPIVVYVNRGGGQDELVFDGGSFVLNSQGKVVAMAEDLFCDEPIMVETFGTAPIEVVPDTDSISHLYDALVLATRDYVRKNGFETVFLGLSGGIDSVLTLAIASDALGAENVHAVMMPFRYTGQMSRDDAAAEAAALGTPYSVISIEPMYGAFMAGFADDFALLPTDVTEENLQARCRGMILMSLANKHHGMVLTTGNKSEMSVGYATLYGDMAGGFAVLKDVPKTLVYRLARHRNTMSQVIPENVLTRAPSAELALGQVDQDSLPPYDILDAIVDAYVVARLSIDEIVARGIAPIEVVEEIVTRIDRNEHKRRQSPPGPKVTRLGLSPDAGRRVPITFDRQLDIN